MACTSSYVCVIMNNRVAIISMCMLNVLKLLV